MYILGAISCALTLVFFGIIDLAPSTLRFSPMTQTAAVGTVLNADTLNTIASDEEQGKKQRVKQQSRQHININRTQRYIIAT